MGKVTVQDLMNITKAKLLQGDSTLEIKNLNIDTRELQHGEIFVAIEAGNNYIETALQKGAKAIILEKEPEQEILNQYPNTTIVKVENSITALQQLAKYKREQYDIPVIAITGSVGKTSTKDIIAKVVSQKYNTLKTEGNFNNHIGLPLTILRLENHEAMVVEMGMNHPGEISVLTNIAKPTIAVITNIGTSHIGILGSRENILKAKLEILEGLVPNGKIIINNDNDLLHEWNQKEKRAITYGIENSSNIMAKNTEQTSDNSTFTIEGKTITVPVGGTHFIYNSLAAISVGKELDIPMEKIAEGIANLELTKKRMETKEINGCTIICDFYNASYESTKYALEHLRNKKATRTIAVLGDMLELGDYSKELHEKVGKEVKADILITVGKEAQNIAKTATNAKEIYTFNTNEEAGAKLKQLMQKGDAILLKASNGMKFGEILEIVIGS